MIRMKFDAVLTQFKLKIMILFLVKVFEARKLTAVLLTEYKDFNVVMHSDVHDWICFKPSVIIDIFALCILILV